MQLPATMLYGAELWPLTVARKKKPEATHHKFQTWIMGISWKDKVSSERVRVQTQLETIDLIIKERRLRWLGHVPRMDDHRLPRQAVHLDISGTKTKPGRQQKNWIDNIQDLKSTSMTWEVAQKLPVNREGWHRRVAQCVFDMGWTNLQGLRSQPKLVVQFLVTASTIIVCPVPPYLSVKTTFAKRHCPVSVYLGVFLV